MHGLLLDIGTGKLDWIVNGYETWQPAPVSDDAVRSSGPIAGALGSLGAFNIGEMKFPEGKIGELATKAEDWLAQKVEKIEAALPGTPETQAGVAKQVVQYAERHWPKPAGLPPKIPAPPPLRPRIIPPRGRR